MLHLLIDGGIVCFREFSGPLLGSAKAAIPNLSTIHAA